MNTNTFFPLFTYHPITVPVHNETVALIKFTIWSRRVISFAMADKTLTEVFLWLKSLSPSMKLERLSPEFETRGFRSRRSLAYVQTEDLDLFFPSPTKLLLAERCILEAEFKKIKAENNGQSTTWAKTTECSTKFKHCWRTYESNVPAVLTWGRHQQHWSDQSNPTNLS